jgi:hypothetical protein
VSEGWLEWLKIFTTDCTDFTDGEKNFQGTQSASFQSVNQRNQWFTFLVSHSKQLRNIKPPEDGDECDAGEDGARSCATPLIKEKTTFL